MAATLSPHAPAQLISTGASKRTERFKAWIPNIERTGGILLLLAAAYFAYRAAAYAGWVPPRRDLFGN